MVLLFGVLSLKKMENLKVSHIKREMYSRRPVGEVLLNGLGVLYLIPIRIGFVGLVLTIYNFGD